VPWASIIFDDVSNVEPSASSNAFLTVGRLLH
jgi:hypothetical protein